MYRPLPQKCAKVQYRSTDRQIEGMTDKPTSIRTSVSPSVHPFITHPILRKSQEFSTTPPCQYYMRAHRQANGRYTFMEFEGGEGEIVGW